MSQNVLVVGGGGREHAICWKLSQSQHVKQIFASPGSHAISKVPKVKNVTLDIKNFKVIYSVFFLIMKIYKARCDIFLLNGQMLFDIFRCRLLLIGQKQII